MGILRSVGVTNDRMTTACVFGRSYDIKRLAVGLGKSTKHLQVLEPAMGNY